MKKAILVISILVVVVAGICWRSMRPAKAIPVNGTLSAQDVADIKEVVKKDLRRKVLPNLSWRSFKGLTVNARNYFKYEILEINAATSSIETIAVVRLPGRRTSVEFVALYRMSKTAGLWKMNLVLPMISRRIEKQFEASLLRMPYSPTFLTNHAPRPLFVPSPPPINLPPRPVRQMPSPFALAVPNPVQPFQTLPSSADFVQSFKP